MLDQAIGQFLDNNKSPSRKVGQLDNRGSHYFLAQYWASALAKQDKDAELKAYFAPLAEGLVAAEEQIVAELNGAQGGAVELGGYYKLDPVKAEQAMRRVPA